MSSKVKISEIMENVGAIHKTLGEVWVIGKVEHTGWNNVWIVRKDGINLHLAEEYDLSDFWYWGE